MLVDNTNFGLVLTLSRYHANFYWFEFFSAFHWSASDTPPASQCITVQTNIGNTERAMHSWISDKTKAG